MSCLLLLPPMFAAFDSAHILESPPQLSVSDWIWLLKAACIFCTLWYSRAAFYVPTDISECFAHPFCDKIYMWQVGIVFCFEATCVFDLNLFVAFFYLAVPFFQADHSLKCHSSWRACCSLLHLFAMNGILCYMASIMTSRSSLLYCDFHLSSSSGLESCGSRLQAPLSSPFLLWKSLCYLCHLLLGIRSYCPYSDFVER